MHVIKQLATENHVAFKAQYGKHPFYVRRFKLPWQQQDSGQTELSLASL